jgi:hypothetical protein
MVYILIFMMIALFGVRLRISLACCPNSTDPYYCAKGSSVTATNACMTSPQNINVNDLTTQTTRYASSGDIDATNNMYNDRVFIFGGTLDTAVVQGTHILYINYNY